MTITEAAAFELTYFSPEERSIPDSVTYPGRNAAVKSALNSALQDLFGKGKPWVRTDERGAVIYAPKSVTIAVTQGSTAGTITGWQSWMAGCTIVIEGSSVDNQIRNASSTVVLKFPHDGATGTATATVYHDSVTVDADVLEVNPPVRLNRKELLALANPYSRPYTTVTEDFGFRHRGSNLEPRRIETSAGSPVGYCVETWSPSATEEPGIRIRLVPAPAVQSFLDYSVMLRPPVITDIEDESNLPIPFQFMESIFLPIATKKLMGCPFWRAGDAVAQVESDYQNALSLLEGANPRPVSGIRFTSSY